MDNVGGDDNTVKTFLTAAEVHSFLFLSFEYIDQTFCKGIGTNCSLDRSDFELLLPWYSSSALQLILFFFF